MAKEKKAKIEPTLEELQAKKAKRQRGWVRFCAIILAVALTAGMYGLASSGDPEVISVYPNTVQVSGSTAKNDEPATQPSSTTPSDSSTPAATTPATSDDEGGILDTIMGLLSGIDLSSLAGKLDFSGLGITVAGGIQNVKDSLLTLVDKIESTITQKPTIAHDAVEYPFAEDADVGSLAERQIVVDLLNRATALGADAQGYILNRQSDYTSNGHVSVGDQTETLNKILGTADPEYTLDNLIGRFAGVGTVLNASNTSLVDDQENYALIATQLTAEDIRIVDDSKMLTGEYTIQLKNVDNPNRQSDCGLTRLTNDYLVQNEVADEVQNNFLPIKNSDLNTLRLADLNMKYSDIIITFKVNLLTGELESLTYSYEAYGKFTARTNTVQVIGAATTSTTATYSNFDYSNRALAG